VSGMSFDLADRVTPVLDKMQATLAERAAIHDAIAESVQAQCKEYVAADAPNRHGSALALGANPTGFLEGAINAITRQADENDATISATHPWFARVGHDVDIYPLPPNQFLAIPISAESYGIRLRGSDLPSSLYMFVREVHQKQDRGRLPSDEDISAEALLTVKEQLFERLEALDRLILTR